MRRKLTCALAASAASVALVAAGCGGDDESGATGTAEWADEFCTAVSAWTDELRQVGDSFDDPSSLDVDAVKQAGEDLREPTDEFVADLRALGAPDTESGQEVEESLDTLADTVEEEKNDIEEVIDDVSDVTDLPSAITVIGTSVTAMGTAFQQALEAIENADATGELETALEQSDACDEIVGSSG